MCCAVYTGDVLLNTALWLCSPTQWSKKCSIFDVVDKYVPVFDRLLDPPRSDDRDGGSDEARTTSARLHR